MPGQDKETLAQINLLAQLLGSMPPQAGSTQRIPVGVAAKRRQWAAELVKDFGVRVHLELATKEMADDGPQVFGNVQMAGMRRERAVDKLDFDFLVGVLRKTEVPQLLALADQIETAKGNPMQERALRDHISLHYPDVIATAQQMVEQTPPEEFEQ